MGSSFFGGVGHSLAEIGAHDPLARVLNLPGANFLKNQAQGVQSNAGPYAGVAPTLAAANAGYVPGGPGATQGWTPNMVGNYNGTGLQGSRTGPPQNFSPAANPFALAARNAQPVQPGQGSA